MPSNSPIRRTLHIAQQKHAKCAPVYLIKNIENTTDQHAIIVIADRAVWILNDAGKPVPQALWSVLVSGKTAWMAHRILIA